jgi:uncharacterized protein (TIGR00255 family)
MNSMTGYGRAGAALGEFTLGVEVSSVNRRGFDLTLSLPEDWQSLESSVTAAVRRVVLRGKVHVAVEISGGSNPADAWDEAAVTRALKKLATYARKKNISFAPTPELLWQIASAQRTGTKPPAAAVASAPLLAALGEALQALGIMRAQEGAALLRDFLDRLAKLAEFVQAIAARAPEVPAIHRELLLQRLRQAGLGIDAADERVLKELALFADRCDVSEELTRLRHHLGQLGETVRANGEAGRKAEFILQEIGREIHTVGSKANDLAIAQAVIGFKNELERVREQMANVE